MSAVVPGQSDAPHARALSPAREAACVAVLALGFGLVGVDRYMIATLFPVIARDLHLDYGDIGTVTGALAIAWGLAALLMGNLADRVGRRPVLVGSLCMFSALIGGSGLATGLASLVAVRLAMGFADGAFTPPSIAATLGVSAPRRRGLNIGVQQMAGLLFGLGLAPLAVSALLAVVDWRWIFAAFAGPGLLLAWATARVLPPEAPRAPTRSAAGDWRAALASGNVRRLMALMLCWLTCLVTLSAFLPSYLLDHLRLPFGAMSRVMSAIGFGAAVGTILLPWLSDRVGRRRVMLGGNAGALAGVLALAAAGPSPALLFACLFATMFCVMALITLTVGPMCEESVAPALAATASGLVIAAGELFGGGLAPVLAGRIAKLVGIEHVTALPTAALVVALPVAFGLRETLAPFSPSETDA